MNVKALCLAALVTGAASADMIRGMQGTNADVIREKCIVKWGYGAPDKIEACVAMGIADYCSNGGTNTQTGTPVLIYDADALPLPGIDRWQPWNDTSPLMYFEAGWRDFSATTKKYGSPLCLSKKRWATLPMNGPCPDVLPDPRVDQKARFCEDLVGADVSLLGLETNDHAALEALHERGAVIFDKSAILDGGLHVWRGEAGQLLTTTKGFDSGGAFENVPPAPGYVPARRDSLVGVVLSENFHWFLVHPDALIGSPLVTIDPRGLLELVTYKRRDGRLVTTTHDLSDAVFQREGYVFKTRLEVERAARVLTPAFMGTPKPLSLWKNRVTGDYATLIAPPSTDWMFVQPEGWILRAN